MNIKEITFPESLSSTRLILRILADHDKEKLFEMYSNEESARYDDWIPFKKIEEAEDMIANSKKSFDNKEEVRYGIEVKENSRLVGSCGIFGFDEWNKKCMVFYQIHHNERNNGYATEAVKLLTTFAFEILNANRIEAYVTPGNDASLKVLEKNGFLKEGLLREMEFYKNKFWDGIVMGMLKKDFDSLKLSE